MYMDILYVFSLHLSFYLSGYNKNKKRKLILVQEYHPPRLFV